MNTFYRSLSASFFVLLSTSVYASDTELTLINHFNHAIDFVVGINPEVLPDFHGKFTLQTQEQIKTQVLDNDKEAYINGKNQDAKADFAFFGVKDENSKTVIHGYLSSGIAYSWSNDILTFCTPEEYKKKKSC